MFVAGHRGLVGSAIVRRLEAEGCLRLLLRTRGELDLTDAAKVDAFFAAEKPEFVFDAAARVGGILANDSQPAEFLLENLKIQTHLIESSWRHGVRKFLFLGSSCIYPRHAPQPLNEDALLNVPANGVLGNDSDPEGDAMHAVLASGANSGRRTAKVSRLVRSH